MSVVTDIILVTAIDDGGSRDGDHPSADVLSAYLQREHFRDLRQVDEYAGGDKSMQCDVFMAAINHLDMDEFVELSKSVEWEEPGSAQLMLKVEDGEEFVIYTP